MTTSRITSEFIRGLNALAIGSRSALVKPGELESAISRPAWLSHYQPGQSPHTLAAELAYGIIMNHPFADGDKRTAFLAANEYLRERGHKAFFESNPDQLPTSEDMMLAIGDAHHRVAKNELSAEGLAAVYAEALRV
jgi:prophage maintenance system killer protein